MLTYKDRQSLFTAYLVFIQKYANTKDRERYIRQLFCGYQDRMSKEELDRWMKASKGSLKEHLSPPPVDFEISPCKKKKTRKIKIRYNQSNHKNANEGGRQMNPKNKVLTERITIRITPEIRRLMEEVATLSDDRSLAEFVRRVVLDHLRYLQENDVI